MLKFCHSRVFFALALFLVTIILNDSCSKEVTMKAISQDASSNNSCDIESNRISSTSISLSKDDAVIVSDLFSKHVGTKSISNAKVKEVSTINLSDNTPGIYVVSYDDGYRLISATKKYFPIIAEVEHGNYDSANETGESVVLKGILEDIETATQDSTKSVDRSFWLPYEEKVAPKPATRANDDYFDMLEEQYMGEWMSSGCNVYYLYDKPETMPTDLYDYFYSTAEECSPQLSGYPFNECAIITEDYYYGLLSNTKGPFLTTTWSQMPSFKVEGMGNAEIGCSTIAIAQLMKYYQYPTKYHWSLMQDNFAGNELKSFLYNLRQELHVDYHGGASINDIVRVLINNGYSVIKKDHINTTRIDSYINNRNPIIMCGYCPEGGHAWVCDGSKELFLIKRYTLYLLMSDYNGELYMDKFETREYPQQEKNTYYHMNWGWSNGEHNGYFLDSHLNPTETRIFDTDRQDIFPTII